MKKCFAFAAVCVLALGALAGCTSPVAKKSNEAAAGSQTNTQTSAPKTDYPKKPITLIVSFAAGGGTDLGARLLTPILEKELGVPVVVENKPGGGGWVGYSELLNAKPDGYTLAYVNTPGLITGYVNPTAKRKENLDSFDFIINHVLDAGVIAVRASDDRFANVKDLIEYAKKNELSTSSNGVGSGNHFASLQMNKQLGTKFRAVQFSGTSEALTSVLGSHVDVLIAKVGEVVDPMKEGQLKVLAVMMPNRVPQLPDVPTLKEAVGVNIENYSIRGIAGPKGMDPQIVAKLQEALEKAMKNPEHVKKMSDMGLNIDTTKGEDFKKMLQKEEAGVNELKSLLGW
ncbi:tripartite tricarboxylate transporter substrate binding protein [Paenibacillus hamazuiensis]|uniref:tripartite tricarboxylate transporter substrate binding protein n=1 Tax=Paenibacillus hamazuiensis TaxID=2936508 RepID=UPI00200E8E6C|nr:tripartite tricarboxylate transporter substrate binding protein [Paenibacillus hamazuiensis]